LGERCGRACAPLACRRLLYHDAAWLPTLAAAAIGVGFLLVDALLPVHAIGHTDESVNSWFAHHRTSSLNDATFFGSAVGDIPAIPGLVILTAVGSMIERRWRIAAFIVGAILLEVATYRLSSLLVHRERPTVPRLDHLPVNQSYPSGHVAASVTVYIGLAMLMSSYLRVGWLRAFLWGIAVVLPLVVATSRMYRGMHHPLDVTAGALIGFSSIAIALLATRAADAAAHLHSSTREPEHEAHRSHRP
jgi:membrane-associated phospholipid phosphatase